MNSAENKHVLLPSHSVVVAFLALGKWAGMCTELYNIVGPYTSAVCVCVSVFNTDVLHMAPGGSIRGKQL